MAQTVNKHVNRRHMHGTQTQQRHGVVEERRHKMQACTTTTWRTREKHNCKKQRVMARLNSARAQNYKYKNKYKNTCDTAQARNKLLSTCLGVRPQCRVAGQAQQRRDATRGAHRRGAPIA
jgi:hypothetical protein